MTAMPGHSDPPKILLVDDDPFMLNLQSHMLRRMGYERLTAVSSALTAMDLLRQGGVDPDIVVCDLNMPGMDGVEFLQALNAGLFSGAVILLSGEGVRIMHTVQKLLGGGRLKVLGALEKPARADDLRTLLSHWRPPAGPARPPADAISIGPEALVRAAQEAQWVLHYQPKVNLQSGAVTGVESLVRWQHPTHGLVYPDAFIHVAEEHGIIGALTDWVFREALRQLALWHTMNLPLQMAINVSMESLRTTGFAAHVGALVRDAGVSPQDVTLEITESRLMSPSPEPLENLVRLRMQRLGLSIDDFGTGHSSLAQLRDVPFNELKIDRGFVHGARSNQIIRPMLEGSIGIGKRLGMLCVAEGVESEEDWHLLRAIDCDLAQGYFIGQPMPAAQLPAWVAQWEARRPALTQPRTDSRPNQSP